MLPVMNRLLPAALVITLSCAGCLSVKTEPIEVKPIHITVDVNVKIDRALNDFFGDLDKKAVAR
jgi:hypothetical protein